jgi:membrane associated rhomboid family serine protease
MIIPYQVDVPMSRWPLANFAIIAATTLFFLLMLTHDGKSEHWMAAMILDGWSPAGLFGHVFLHADPIHLLGNMLFLWVFGNAVCAKIGNAWFPLAYFVLALFAAAAHNVIDGSLAIGASGAINGVVGMFLVFYPLNSISCLLLIGFFWGGGWTFSLSSWWMILLWFIFDLWGASTGESSVAHWAHIGGFAAGVGIAIVLLLSGWVEMDERERSLIEVIRKP